MQMQDFGVTVFRGGVVFHLDGRPRRRGLDGEPSVLPGRLRRRVVRFHVKDGREVEVVQLARRRGGYRGRIRGFTPDSVKRLRFVLASAAAEFRTLLTLTYRAPAEAWEEDGERNRRIVERSKKDLHRFLCTLRKELGAYVWAQEFQKRGVIHYHVICEGVVTLQRARLAWLQAIGALDDQAAFAHGVKADPVGDQERVRTYLGTYMGKCDQKALPAGVDRAGRWWGRSRSLKLEVLAAVVSCERTLEKARRAETRVVRALVNYMTRLFRERTLRAMKATKDQETYQQLKKGLRRRFRGGWFVNRGGELAATLARMIARLREYYGVTLELPESIEAFRWAVDEWVDEEGRVHEIRPVE